MSARRNRTVRLSDEENADVDRIAAEEGRSFADMTRRLLVEAINARTARGQKEK